MIGGMKQLCTLLEKFLVLGLIWTFGVTRILVPFFDCFTIILERKFDFYISNVKYNNVKITQILVVPGELTSSLLGSRERVQ